MRSLKTAGMLIVLIQALFAFNACQEGMYRVSPVVPNPIVTPPAGIDDGGGVGNGLEPPVLSAAQFSAASVKLGDILAIHVQATTKVGDVSAVSVKLAPVSNLSDFRELALTAEGSPALFSANLAIDNSFSDDHYVPVSITIQNTQALSSVYVYDPKETVYLQQKADNTNVRTTVQVPMVWVETGNPNVKITSPVVLNGQTVHGIVKVAADASDTSKITKLELFINDLRLAIVTDQPHIEADVDTETLYDGPITIRAEATDEFGNIGTTHIFTAVDNVPALTFDAPQPVTQTNLPYSFQTNGEIVSITADTQMLAIHADGRISYNYYYYTNNDVTELEPRMFLKLNDAAKTDIITPGANDILNFPSDRPTAILFDYDLDGFNDLLISTSFRGEKLYLYRADPATAYPLRWKAPEMLSLEELGMSDCFQIDLVPFTDHFYTIGIGFLCYARDGSYRYVTRDLETREFPHVLKAPVVLWEHQFAGSPRIVAAQREGSYSFSFTLITDDRSIYSLKRTGPLSSDHTVTLVGQFPESAGSLSTSFHSQIPAGGYIHYDSNLKRLVWNRVVAGTSGAPWTIGETTTPTIRTGSPFYYNAAVKDTWGPGRVKARMEGLNRLGVYRLRTTYDNATWNYLYSLSKVGPIVVDGSTIASETNVAIDSNGETLDLRLNDQPFFELNVTYTLNDVVDITGDGQVDLILSKNSTSYIFEKAESAGVTFWQGRPFSITSLSENSYFTDMNRDGILDLVTCGSLGVKAFLNSGTNMDIHLASPITIPISDASLCAYLAFVDIDYDNDIDILIGGRLFSIIENSGTPSSPNFADAPASLMVNGVSFDLNAYAPAIAGTHTPLSGFPLISGSHAYPEVLILDDYTRLLRLANVNKR